MLSLGGSSVDVMAVVTDIVGSGNSAGVVVTVSIAVVQVDLVKKTFRMTGTALVVLIRVGPLGFSRKVVRL